MPPYKPSTLLYIFILLFLSACFTNHSKNKNLERQAFIADSLITAGKGDSAIRLMKKIRPEIKPSDPVIAVYYRMLAENSRYQPATMQLYIDSALTYFTDQDRREKYPDEYYQVLLIKGEASMTGRRYNMALDNFYRAEKISLKNGCDDGALSARIGSIYYSQKNYARATRHFIISEKKLQSCRQNLSPEKFFFMRQSVLNSLALAYQKDGKLDSARYWFNTDLAFIDKTTKSKTIDTLYTHGARMVVYDNLGGLSLKQNDLLTAAAYLNKCIATPNPDVDGIKIPPLIKLAELYVRTGQYARADSAFKRSRQLLNRFYKQNPDSHIQWNKLYAEYLFKKKQTEKAYAYQRIYFRMKDSLENTLAKFYRLDVTRELNVIHQQQELTNMKHRNKLKRYVMAGIAVSSLLFMVIILLVYRNLAKSRKNQHDTELQNQKMQHTLAELERANKNYIRIMRVMAHDLRNPLSGMTGLAAMLLGEDDFTEESRQMLRLIETTGIHSMEMINELLKSGLADENEAISLQPLDLRALLFDSVELLQFKAKEKKQRIIFESDDTPVIANVNHEKIWRVFNNLIVNAIKFSHEGGVIHAGIRHDEKRILISVADSGIGIPDKDKENIFEMFTPAKRVGTGGEQPFGLGLSISKKIIEKHHGKIWFESTQGVGTTFYIELPFL